MSHHDSHILYTGSLILTLKIHTQHNIIFKNPRIAFKKVPDLSNDQWLRFEYLVLSKSIVIYDCSDLSL